MGQIKSFAQVAKEAKRLKKEGKTIGLITGCFDIIHIGHIQTFRHAKKHCDVVIVGLDNDTTIKINKGEKRPIHDWKSRSYVLSELSSIDYIFKIKTVVNFESKDANLCYERIVKGLKPNYLITNPIADKFWRAKKLRAELIGAKLLMPRQRKKTSTTSIIEKLGY